MCYSSKIWHIHRNLFYKYKTYVQDSRKLTDDNKKRKRMPHVVVICFMQWKKVGITFIIHKSSEEIIYTLICIQILLIMKRFMLLWSLIKLLHITSIPYIQFIYSLTTGNKEWWTSSCAFYCCVSRTQSDMLGKEKTKSDHT